MLTTKQINQIKAEIEQVATEHLNTSDIDTALSHFTNDIYAVSNTDVFPSRAELATHITGYYNLLKQVNYASWEDISIHVIDHKAATFSAKFRYDFTSTNSEQVKLKGVWTALYIREQSIWKIRLRHESFKQL